MVSLPLQIRTEAAGDASGYNHLIDRKRLFTRRRVITAHRAVATGFAAVSARGYS